MQGDPIEVGAAAAVLHGRQRADSGGQALVLEADKTAIGHTEPAAGLTGAMKKYSSDQRRASGHHAQEDC